MEENSSPLPTRVRNYRQWINNLFHFTIICTAIYCLQNSLKQVYGNGSSFFKKLTTICHKDAKNTCFVLKLVAKILTGQILTKNRGHDLGDIYLTLQTSIGISIKRCPRGVHQMHPHHVTRYNPPRIDPLRFIPNLNYLNPALTKPNIT